MKHAVMDEGGGTCHILQLRSARVLQRADSTCRLTGPTAAAAQAPPQSAAMSRLTWMMLCCAVAGLSGRAHLLIERSLVRFINHPQYDHSS